MEKTIADLRIGDKLLLGAYSASAGNSAPPPIVWVKADYNNRFLSERAVDYLVFDAREPGTVVNTCYDQTTVRRGNPDFSLSNLCSFLNSAEEGWYIPTHEKDTPPERYYWDVNSPYSVYFNHPGFLYNFEAAEIACLVDQYYGIGGGNTAKIILLKEEEIVGNGKLPYFNRRGVRAKFTDDLCRWKSQVESYSEAYAPYYTMSLSNNGIHVRYCDKSCGFYGVDAATAMGIRPICALKPETKVRLVNGRLYEIVLPKAQDEPNKEDLMNFLGLALP